jgi:hypothetical protein
MATTHALLLKCRDDGLPDEALAAELAAGAAELRWAIADVHLYRALVAPEIYAYLELARPTDSGAEDALRAAFSKRAPTIDRLERRFDAPGASRVEEALFHYVVEMDPAHGWLDEIVRWYDAEHMPGLAAAPGCVRAQRFVNHDSGPLSLACYDLTRPETTESPAWLAVRHTAWSDQVRPHFRNAKRTMFRSLPARSGHR